jgi:hypothetical protein
MSNPYLSKEDIKNAYLTCDFKDKDGLFAGEDVEIYELADAIIKSAAFEIARVEREFCIEFVESLNPEVAKALRDKRGNL